jgi:hypothetical protein
MWTIVFSEEQADLLAAILRLTLRRVSAFS